MRGAPNNKVIYFCFLGIIPADAGSTGTDALGRNPIEDHPRRCGEHDRLPVRGLHSQGSSPQMRGALHRPGGEPCEFRIIPADAGSTV